MTTASELITRGLRLINVPGRGASLAAEDQSNALEALQELLDSEAVSKQFVPGIRRHFFTLNSNQSIYTYGASPQFELRSDDFGLYTGDPAPIHIESCYVRQGSNIVDNENIDQYRFENVGIWVVTGGGVISNNELVMETVIGGATQDLSATTIDITSGLTTYTVRINVTVNNGSAQVTFLNNAVVFETFILDTSGFFEFDFVWPAGTLPSVSIDTLLATDDVSFTEFSLIERGLPRLELPDGIGTDYGCRMIDQTTYNRQAVKGSGGRVYEILYSRSANQAGELRFDNSGVAGDILVLDVLVNTVQVSRPSDPINLNPEAIRWLRYALADNVSGEYGKTLNPRQLQIMQSAWDALASGNRRINLLGVDRGLRRRPWYDINRGDY